MSAPTRRGTSNTNVRGNVYDRAARRAFLLTAFGDGVTCLCYRCGAQLDDSTVTADRKVPGRDGGTYHRENLRPACVPCNSETGGALSRTNGLGIRTVLGCDPGATVGLVRLDLDGYREPLLTQVPAADAQASLEDLLGAQDPAEVIFAIEAFVVGYRAGRSSTPAAGRTTRLLIGSLSGWAVDRGIRVVVRTASEVKTWASDTRLRAAGLYVKGAPHARDGGRHALFSAVSDAGFPDPLSARSRSPR